MENKTNWWMIIAIVSLVLLLFSGFGMMGFEWFGCGSYGSGYGGYGGMMHGIFSPFGFLVMLFSWAVVIVIFILFLRWIKENVIDKKIKSRVGTK
jgi:cytochrome b subunit of formate dehydrogenase